MPKMRGWGLVTLAIALLLSVAWHKTRGMQQQQLQAVDDAVLLQVQSRFPTALAAHFVKLERVPHAGDEDDVGINVPAVVQRWSLRDNGLVDITLRDTDKQLTLVPVVLAKRAGLTYVPFGELSEEQRMTQGGIMFHNDAEVAAQLLVNEARLFDGEAGPGQPARRVGWTQAGSTTEQRSCANARPLRCSAETHASRLTSDTHRASAFARSRDADEVCAAQFGRSWKLQRVPSTSPWPAPRPVPLEEGWVHNDAPTAANCWASS